LDTEFITTGLEDDDISSKKVTTSEEPHGKNEKEVDKDVQFFNFEDGISAPELPTTVPEIEDSTLMFDLQSKSEFEIRNDFNNVVGVWIGSLISVKCDAIVVPVTRKLQSTGSIYDRVIDQGGQELISRFSKMEWCNTGDAGICAATEKMNVKYVVFASAPNFMRKRKKEAMNVMCECYLRVLEHALRNNCRTILLPIIQPKGKQFPEKMALSLIAKSIRTFLEENPNGVGTVIIPVENQKQYNLVCHAFGWIFPRSKSEVKKGKRAFEQYSGKQREIRLRERRKSADNIEVPSKSKSTIGGSERLVRVGYNKYRDRFGFQEEIFQTHRTYKSNRLWLGSDKKLDPVEIPFKNAYTRLLNRALRHILTDLEAHQFLYKSGKDHLNRQVIVWVASRFPAYSYEKGGQLNRVIMYIIRKLHTLVEKDYIIMYLHAKSKDRNFPPVSWTCNLFRLLNHRYSENLRGFYVVHPTVLLKSTMWFLSKTSFWKKIVFISSMKELLQEHRFDPKMISIPGRVWEYDRDLHGNYWIGLSPQPGLRSHVINNFVGLDYDINHSVTPSSQVVETFRSLGKTVTSWVSSFGEITQYHWQTIRNR